MTIAKRWPERGTITEMLEWSTEGCCVVGADHAGVFVVDAARGNVTRFTDPFHGGHLSLEGLGSSYVPLSILRLDAGWQVQILAAVEEDLQVIVWDMDESGTYIGQETLAADHLDWLPQCNCLDLQCCRHLTLRFLAPEVRNKWIERLSQRASTLGRHVEAVAIAGKGRLLSEAYFGDAGAIHRLHVVHLSQDVLQCAAVLRHSSLTQEPLNSFDGNCEDPQVWQAAYHPAAHMFSSALHPGLTDFFGEWLHFAAAESLATVKAGFFGTLSPVTQEFISSRSSVLVDGPEIPWLTIGYEAGLNSFVEIRGGGWSGSIKAILVPRWQRLFVFGSADSWGDVASASTLNRVFQLWFLRASAHVDPSVSPQVLVLPEPRNLGHWLWQVMSGASQVESLTHYAESGNLSAFVRSSSWIGFVAPLADQATQLVLPPGWQPVDWRESTFDEIAQLNVVPMMHLSPHFDEEFRSRLVDWALSASQEEATGDNWRILVNLRGHNKRWLNASEVLPVALRALTQLTGRGVEVVLEYLGDAAELADDLTQALRENLPGAQVDHCVDADLPTLLKWASRCSFAICPVGSGLVVPTWVLGLPSVAHGDHAHVGQLAWWGSVSEAAGDGLVNEVPYAGIRMVTERSYGYDDYMVDGQFLTRALLMTAVGALYRQRGEI